MAKRDRIKELERQYGDLHKVIPPLLNIGVWQRLCNECNGSGCTDDGYEACYYCDGRGWFNVECKTCFGTGVL